MKVTLEPELARRKPLADLVEGALPSLKRVLGSAVPRVTTVWDFRSDERGEPKIRLSLTDTLAGEGTAELSPEELQSTERATESFGRLWDQMLREASERHMRALEEAELPVV